MPAYRVLTVPVTDVRSDDLPLGVTVRDGSSFVQVRRPVVDTRRRCVECRGAGSWTTPHGEVVPCRVCKGTGRR